MTPFSVQLVQILLIYFMLLYMSRRMTGGGGGGGGGYPLNALHSQVTDHSVHMMPHGCYWAQISGWLYRSYGRRDIVCPLSALL